MRRPEETREAVAVEPSLGELFTGFLGIGLLGFGGVLPMARRMIVEDRRWMTAAEFGELLGLCQFLPGGNVINLSVATGIRFRGPIGAMASLVGLVTVPGILVIALGLVYSRFADNPQVRHAFAGLAAAAAGLLIGTVVKLAVPLRRNPVMVAAALICFVAIAILRLPLLPTLLVLLPLSIAAARLLRA